LIWIKRTDQTIGDHGQRPAEAPMTTDQFYYLLLVIFSFVGFGLAMGVAYIRYRRWLATQPPRHV
jgi:hypothetical protein